MNKVVKFMQNTFNIISVMLVILFVASYLDIIAHNISDYDYAWWNVFYLFPNK